MGILAQNLRGFYKLQGIVAGADLVTNGAFAADTDWTKGANWSIAGDRAQFAGSGTATLSQATVIVIGRKYRVTYTVLNRSAGGVTVRLGSTGSGTLRSSDGTYVEDIQALGTGTTLYFVPDATFVGDIDDVSVQRLYETDASGNGFHATVFGATPATGIIGSGYDLDGTDDYLLCDNPMDIIADGSFTIAARWKSSHVHAASHILFSTYDGGNPHYAFYISSTRKLQTQTTDSNSANINPASSANVNDGVDYFGAVVRDGANDIITSYLNGASFSSQADTRTGHFTNAANNNRHWIGRMDSGLYFQGMFDELYLWDRAVPAAQLRSFMAGYQQGGM